MPPYRAFSFSRASNALAALALLSSLGACKQMQSGQVAASVNGEEITFQEIDAELRSVYALRTLGPDEARAAALERIVERRLMAQAARREGLHESSAFLLRQRQLRDALLAQLLREQTAQSLKAPTKAAIDEFIEANPLLFAERKLFVIRQLEFSIPAGDQPLKTLETAANLSGVADLLDQQRIPYEESMAELDSHNLGTTETQAILRLDRGEPFILPQGSQAIAAVVTDTRSEPLIGDEASALAAAKINREQADRSIKLLLSELREDAKLEYQDGVLDNDGEEPQRALIKPAEGSGSEAQ